MATITVEGTNAIGTTASLAAGVSSSALHTVPALTGARLLRLVATLQAGTALTVALLINDIALDDLDATVEKDYVPGYIYLTAGDVVKLKNTDGANAGTWDYYISMLEQT